MLNKRSQLHILAAIISTVMVGYARIRMGWMEQSAVSLQDALMARGRSAPADPNLVFLARDTASANLEATDLENLFDLRGADRDSRRALTLMAQEWPWSREVYALILDKLFNAGARAVAFDLTFPKPSHNDDAFRDRLAKYGDHVVVAGNITEDLDGNSSTSSAPTPSLIPETSPRDSRIGYDNFWPDADGVVRSAQYRWAVQHGVWRGNEELSLAARTLQKGGFSDFVPTDRESYRLRLAGPPGTFRARSIHEIFVPKYWEQNYAGGNFFRGKIIVIGASGNWQHDDHQSALGPISGAELQINAINAALHHEFLRPAPRPLWIAIWAFAELISVGSCIYCASPFLRVGWMVAGAALLGVGQVAVYNRLGLFIPVIGPLSFIGVMGIFSLIYDLFAAGAERLRLQRNIREQKLSEAILKRANDELEGKVKERTVELTASNASLAALLAEKDVLLKEIHHRVKNNLQTISSLLNLQSGNIKDPYDLSLFMETRNRVRSMSLIHEKLYQSHDLSRIDFADYLRTLTSGLAGSFAGASSAIRISVEAEEIMLAVDSAVPCGLIVNELVTNCFKYAFRKGAPGEIRISMKRAEGAQLHLSVSDDGVGFPKDLDFRNTESLGLQLVTSLTDQIEGTIDIRNGSGTSFEIVFPETHKTKL